MPRNKVDLLDEQFGDVIRRIESNQPEILAIPLGFKSSLLSRLTAQYTEQVRPIRHARISLSIIAAVIITGLLYWVVSPQPISAAEIIGHASLAATDTSVFGLKSYSGIKVTWLRDPEVTVQQGFIPANLQEHVWAQAPNLLRDEWYKYSPASQATAGLPENSGTIPSTAYLPTADDLNAVIVNDGSAVWWYDVQGKYVVQHNPNTGFLPSFPNTNGAQPLPIDFKSLLKQLGQAADNVTFLGMENVGGREAYVLSFSPQPDLAVFPATTQIKVWIDKQTYFELGQEYRDKQGIILGKWLYSTFTPSVVISPDMFHFTPPSDVQVIDARAPKDVEQLNVDWWTIALSATYNVLRPTQLPSTLIMERPYYGVLGGYSDGFTQMEQDFYIDGGALPAFFLIEDKYAGQLSTTIGTPIKIDQYNGEYYEGNGRRILQTNVANTWVFLQADQHVMTKDELIQIAKTLSLVSKAYPSF